MAKNGGLDDSYLDEDDEPKDSEIEVVRGLEKVDGEVDIT